jgi:hypothetical protein
MAADENSRVLSEAPAKDVGTERRRLVWSLGTAAVFALLVWGYLSLRANFHVVTAGEIYRSAQPSVADLRETVEDYRIRSIVNLRGSNPEDGWYRREVAASRALQLRHYDVSLRARELPRIGDLLRLLEVLETAPRPLLIHCEQGADRSGFASAVALILDQDAGLERVRRQFSWRYLVYAKDSVGKQFFDLYRDWLRRTGQQHSRERFLYWVYNVYQDSDGNLRFNVNRINDQAWQRGRRAVDGFAFDIDRSRARDLTVVGWAVDERRGSTVKGVQVVFEGEPLPTTQYGLPREDVVQYLGNADYLHSGWRAEGSLARLHAGCGDLALRIRRSDDSVWTSPPQARVCIR